MDASFSCGLGPAFEVIGGKWKTAILWELRARPLRYGRLKRSITGSSEKVLIQQLRELEADNLITRTSSPAGSRPGRLCANVMGREAERGARSGG